MFADEKTKKPGYSMVFALIMVMAVITALMFMFLFNEAKEKEVSKPALISVSQKVLIIDAGHGGEDGGATSKTGLLESGVNLDIALRVELLAGFFGIPSQMTRSSEIIDYPDTAKTTKQRKLFDQKSRVEQINSVENGVLISIHQNNFPDSQPRGPQAFYADTQGSAELAALTHENLKSVLYPESRRVAAPISNKIFLMKNIKCPAILVECAFLSNPDEEALLRTDGHRLKIAAVIMASYLQFIFEQDAGI